MIVSISDLHSNPYGEFSRIVDPDGDSPLGKRLITTAKWVADVCNQYPNSLLVNNGDHTDTPGLLNAGTINILGKIEDEWKGIQRIYNLGNHDQANLEVGFDNLSLHSRIDGVVIPKSGKILKFDCNNGSIYVVPFVKKHEIFMKMLESIPDGSVVAVHYPIIGTRMTPTVSEERGVEIEHFRRFKLTFAGHYHLPQIYHADNRFELVVGEKTFCPLPGTVIVTGTPLPQSFSDTNAAYGIWLYDGNECKFVKNPENIRYVNISVDSVDDFEKRLPVAEKCFLSVTFPKSINQEIRQAVSDRKNIINVRFKWLKVNDDSIKSGRVKITEREDILNTINEFLDKSDVFSSVDRKSVIDIVSPLITDNIIESGSHVSFESLHLNNFMSWGEDRISLSGCGLKLIYGLNEDTSSAQSNGSGKTSLLESLIWVLYDDTIRPIASKDDVVRKGSKGGCSVSVEFSTDSGKYRIERYRKTTKGSGANIYKWCGEGDWQDISNGSVASVNSQIVNLIGIDRDFFMLTCFFGSHFSGKFSDLTDTERKVFLGKVIGLSRYDKLREKVSELLRLKNDERRSCEQFCSSTQATIDRLNKQLSETLLEAEKKESIRMQKIEELKQKISELSVEISKSAEYKLEVKETIDVLVKEIDDITVNTVELREKFLQIKNRNTSEQSKLAELNNSLSKKQRQLNSKKLELNAVPVICPTCLRDLPSESVENVRNSIKTQILPIEEEIAEINNKIVGVIEIIDGGVRESSEIEELIKTKELPLDSISSNVRILSSKLDKLEDSIKSKMQEVNSIDTTIKILESADYRSGVSSIEDAISRESTILVESNNNLTVITEKSTLLDTVYKILGPKALISFVLDYAIISLNEILGELSSNIFGGDYELSLSSSNELKKGGEENKISIVYTTPSGSYGGASDGEKRKADISIQLAINALVSSQMRGSTNIIVADEVLDSLDAVASRVVLESISNFAEEESKIVFVISHSDSVKPFVNNILTVERRQGISRVVGDDL